MDRRSWIAWLGRAVAGLCIGAWTVALARFARPQRTRDLSQRLLLGPTTTLPEGASKYLSEPNIYVMHRAAGFCALSGRCTHLGCSVAQHPEGFFCPCHGAQFDRLGQPVSGPAPRPLTWFRMHIDQQKNLVLHLDETVQPGTWTRA